MSEESEEDEGAGIVTLAYFFTGLSVPVFFRAMAGDAEIGSFIIVFGVLAACVLYGELSVSLSSGLAFGLGMLLMAFAALNGWLVGLGIAAAAVNLAKNWQADSSTIELEGAEFGLPAGSG